MPNDEGNAKFYYKSDAYPDGTTFSVTKALQEGTEENAIIMADIELLASKLKIFKMQMYLFYSDHFMRRREHGFGEGRRSRGLQTALLPII